MGGWSCEKRCGGSQSTGAPRACLPLTSHPSHFVRRCWPKAKTLPLTPSGRAVGSQRGRGAFLWPEGPFLTPASVLTLKGGWTPGASSGFGSGGLPAPTPFGILTKSHPPTSCPSHWLHSHPSAPSPHLGLVLSSRMLAGVKHLRHRSLPGWIPVDKALSCGPAEPIRPLPQLGTPHATASALLVDRVMLLKTEGGPAGRAPCPHPATSSSSPGIPAGETGGNKERLGAGPQCQSWEGDGRPLGNPSIHR